MDRVPHYTSQVVSVLFLPAPVGSPPVTRGIPPTRILSVTDLNRPAHRPPLTPGSRGTRLYAKTENSETFSDFDTEIRMDPKNESPAPPPAQSLPPPAVPEPAEMLQPTPAPFWRNWRLVPKNRRPWPKSFRMSRHHVLLYRSLHKLTNRQGRSADSLSPIGGPTPCNNWIRHLRESIP